jgi:hypothetical protein
MRRRWTVRVGRCVLTLAVVGATPPTSAQGARGSSLTKPDAAAVAQAREGAARRLEDAGCQRVLSDFQDAKGRPLKDKLQEWAVEPAEYLRMIPFVDGSGESRCHRKDVMLVCVPNVPRVRVCPAFAAVQRLRPADASIMVIHEVLHTLGLGEDPPTSAEITQRVEARCR